MPGSTTNSTREVARAAVRSKLARAAFATFHERGFDNVTVTEVAAAAGVSRATFLRYFRTKEDAVLEEFDARGENVARALADRPAGEDDWTSLRRALDTVIEDFRMHHQSMLATMRMIDSTPSLRARAQEKQCGWRPALSQALAARAGSPRSPGLPELVRSAAAMDCLEIAIDQWTASDAQTDLGELLDDAFAALVVM